MNEEWVVDWPPDCRAILDAIRRDPRFDQTARGTGANFYKTGVPKEVRIGWPSGSRHIILAVIRCRGDSGIRIRLNVGKNSGLIGNGGPLREAPRESDATVHRGDYELNSPQIPDALFHWLEIAAKFSRP